MLCNAALVKPFFRQGAPRQECLASTDAQPGDILAVLAAAAAVDPADNRQDIAMLRRWAARGLAAAARQIASGIFADSGLWLPKSATNDELVDELGGGALGVLLALCRSRDRTAQAIAALAVERVAAAAAAAAAVDQDNFVAADAEGHAAPATAAGPSAGPTAVAVGWGELVQQLLSPAPLASLLAALGAALPPVGAAAAAALRALAHLAGGQAVGGGASTCRALWRRGAVRRALGMRGTGEMDALGALADIAAQVTFD